MSEFYGELPFSEEPGGPTRYGYHNPYFGYADAIVLYALMRLHRPKRIVEVGSGHSSAVMLDTNERFLDNSVRCTFIDPDPVRLMAMLRSEDLARHEVIARPVQQLEPSVFEPLEAGDILFIDSSHVARVGSDVLGLMFRVLPRLKPGVLVHFHDILWPFEYPESWFLEGRAWNEAYFVRAFLQFNASFEITCFNSFLGARHHAELEHRMPLCLRDTGGSLWLTRR
jgi:predicted O-methyltransferase YrrM